MKIIVAFLMILSSFSTFAALGIKPGLWEMEMTMGGADGKQVDPMAEMRKAMAKMSPEQQKQMAAMMGKMGGRMGMTPGGAMRICYTKEMLENEANLNQQKDKKCTSTIKEKSAKKIVANFKCEDGTSGNSIFTIQDTSNYSGDVDVTDKSGQKSKMSLKGKFVSNDCGDVKPFNTAMPATAKPVVPPAKTKTATP
ncbi:MAG: DUF3617 domain-containing protein [Bdellovibrio sp.]|nr:DUF3617 domain-containing protein [Bdellovibrio sp.]